MSGAKPRLLICSCEKSMSLDAQAIGRACAAHVTHGDQLCGLELARVNTALAEGGEITIACTQEAPLFKEVAEDLERPTPTFVNIRETAGWSKDAAAAGPKIAALIAAAREEMPPVALVTLESNGVVLIYGRDEVAIEAGRTARRPSRHHRAADEARRRDAAPRQPVPGAEGHRAQRPRLSRQVRACDRRLRGAAAVVARKARVRLRRATARPRPAT